MILESARDRVVRILAVSVGLGSIVFTLLGVGAIARQVNYHPLPFLVIAIVIFCGVPPAMAAVAFRVPVSWLRRVAGSYLLATLLILAAWVPLGAGTPLPGKDAPWILTMITVATCASALVLAPVPAWAYLVVIAAASAVVRFEADARGDGMLAIQDGIMTALFSAVMLSLLQLTLRAGDEQDAAATAAQDAAATATTSEVLERQRTQYQAFTHDNILATLLSAARNTPGTLDLTRESARAALQKLGEFRTAPAEGGDLNWDELESLIIAAGMDTGVSIEISIDPDAHSLRTPQEVADVLTAALAEALRNTIRHAAGELDRPVNRLATAHIRACGIQIVVADDGQGFNPRRIAPDRLGVRVSILHRVTVIPGCTAEIQSVKGRGTTVRLAWKAPQEDSPASAAAPRRRISLQRKGAA